MKIPSDAMDLIQKYRTAKRILYAKHPDMLRDKIDHDWDKLKELANRIKEKFGIDPDSTSIDMDTVDTVVDVSDVDPDDGGSILEILGDLFS